MLEGLLGVGLLAQEEEPTTSACLKSHSTQHSHLEFKPTEVFCMGLNMKLDQVHRAHCQPNSTIMFPAPYVMFQQEPPF